MTVGYLKLNATPREIMTNSSSRITVTIVDSRGKPKRAPIGYWLSLSTSLGQLGNTSILIPAKNTSANTTLIAGKKSGTAMITAKWGGGSDTPTINVKINERPLSRSQQFRSASRTPKIVN